ncbi:MAG: PH domain-containing protein [Pseudomonadota bacterium]
MSPAWRRTSPVAVVFYLARAARFAVTDGIAMFAPAAAWLATASGPKKIWAIGWLVAMAVFGLIWAVLSYLRFRYRVDAKQVLVRRGVLTREQLNIDFDRVQDVSIDQPFYVRPFGLSVLTLDTAGSVKSEVALAGIRNERALELRQDVLRRARPAVEAEDAGPAAVPARQQVLTRDLPDIVRYGLTANGLLWVAVLFGVLGGSFGDEAWSATGRWVIERLQLGNLFDTGTAATKGAIAAGLLLGIPLLLALFSVIGAIWRYANYRLEVDEDTWYRSSGLISRQEQTLKRTKVQAALWRQNAIARLLGRINLQLRLVSAGVEVQASGVPGTVPAFLVPALTPAELFPISARFVPAPDHGAPELSGINRRYHLRRTLMIAMIPITCASIGLSFVLGPWVVLLAAAVLAVLVPLIRLRGKRFGYGVTGTTGVLRSGLIGSLTTVFELRKVQRVDLEQSPGQRRRGLATLSIHLASHSVTVPYIPLHDAQRFADLALWRIESSAEPWF